MRAIGATICAVLLALPSGAELLEQYSADKVSVRRVPKVSSGHATRRAEKGELLEVRALVTAPASGTKLPVDEIRLAGASKGAGKATTWELAPTAIGATWKGNCSYEFPDSLVKGAVGFDGGALWLKREKKGEPAIVEFSSQPVELCAAFLVPAGAGEPVSLRIGGAQFTATWETAK
jgi:hypothetical protein